MGIASPGGAESGFRLARTTASNISMRAGVVCGESAVAAVGICPSARRLLLCHLARLRAR